MMENVIHSDHTFNFVETLLEIKRESVNAPLSHYSTKINEYDTTNATDEEWDNFNSGIASVDWDKMIFYHMDVDKIADIVIDEIERNIVKNMREKV